MSSKYTDEQYRDLAEEVRTIGGPGVSILQEMVLDARAEVDDLKEHVEYLKGELAVAERSDQEWEALVLENERLQEELLVALSANQQYFKEYNATIANRQERLQAACAAMQAMGLAYGPLVNGALLYEGSYQAVDCAVAYADALLNALKKEEP